MKRKDIDIARTEIIQWAREVGLYNLAWDRRLLAFADLVAAHERDRMTRKAATDKEVTAAYVASTPIETPIDWWSDFQHGFRAAERHHGIGEGEA